MDLASPIRSRSPTPLFDRDSFSARNGSVSSVSSHGDAPRGKPYGMRPTLPKPSHLDLDVPSEELQLGDDLKGIPTPFLRDSLRKLGEHCKVLGYTHSTNGRPALQVPPCLPPAKPRHPCSAIKRLTSPPKSTAPSRLRFPHQRIS